MIELVIGEFHKSPIVIFLQSYLLNEFLSNDFLLESKIILHFKDNKVRSVAIVPPQLRFFKDTIAVGILHKLINIGKIADCLNLQNRTNRSDYAAILCRPNTIRSSVNNQFVRLNRYASNKIT